MTNSNNTDSNRFFNLDAWIENKANKTEAIEAVETIEEPKQEFGSFDDMNTHLERLAQLMQDESEGVYMG